MSTFCLAPMAPARLFLLAAVLFARETAGAAGLTPRGLRRHCRAAFARPFLPSVACPTLARMSHLTSPLTLPNPHSPLPHAHQVVFPPSLTARQRALLHEAAGEAGLHHASEGDGADRRIAVGAAAGKRVRMHALGDVGRMGRQSGPGGPCGRGGCSSRHRRTLQVCQD